MTHGTTHGTIHSARVTWRCPKCQKTNAMDPDNMGCSCGYVPKNQIYDNPLRFRCPSCEATQDLDVGVIENDSVFGCTHCEYDLRFNGDLMKVEEA